MFRPVRADRYVADPQTAAEPPLTPHDSQVCFEVGDAVRFLAPGGGALEGTVEKLNPTQARVRCGADLWVVPYPGLGHDSADVAQARRHRLGRLKDVAAEALKLMQRHGLCKWSFRFNGARTQLGQCRPVQQSILLSRVHAVQDPPAQVTDTILHEVAHALAGPEAGHGPEWKAIATRLGATPHSCAPVSEDSRRRVLAAKAGFHTGDTVSFVARGQQWTGVIVRKNPKRAKVQCGDTVWSVSYARLSVAAAPA